MTICNICCEPLNKSNHTKITCPFDNCQFKSCKTCVRKYLLETTADPHCMNCKKAWNTEFIILNLNRSYYENDYKKHRKSILTEREISKLPETIEHAENQKFVDEEQAKLKDLKNQMNELKKQINGIKTQQIVCHNTIYNIKNGGLTKEKRKFIMACPNNLCRGYLSTQYKCELCKLYTCPQCIEIIGINKTDPHVCNPDNVTSAELIKKETKSCPSCGIRIFKIDGCNQMWCTECHVAFDYATGRIDKGIVHNPHYNAHLEQINNGHVVRNPGDILCGGLCNWHDLQHKIIKKLTKFWANHPILQHIVTIHRAINRITYTELVNSRRNVREAENFQQLRIEYLLKKKTINQFTDQIFRKDNQRKKHNDLLHIYEFLSVIGIEIFNSLSSSELKTNQFCDECVKQFEQLNQVRNICNEQFKKISITYNNQITYIENNWKISSKKY